MSERELSKVAPTRRGIHDRLSSVDAGRAPDFDPRRTLRLRVELVRQIKRRRTQVAFGLIFILPIIIAIASGVGLHAALVLDQSDRRSGDRAVSIRCSVSLHSL